MPAKPDEWGAHNRKAGRGARKKAWRWRRMRRRYRALRLWLQRRRLQQIPE